MSDPAVTLRGVDADDQTRQLFAERETPVELTQSDDIWIPADDGTLIRYTVCDRRIVATRAGIRIDLHLRAYVPSLLARLSALPGDAPVLIGISLAAITTVPLIILLAFIFFEPLLSLGWAANNADTAAAVSVGVVLFWLAMHQKYEVTRWYFSSLWLIAAAFTYSGVQAIWPEATSPEAAIDGYAALGQRIVDSRAILIAIAAPYIPATVALIQFVGFKGAATLLEKVWPSRPK